MDSSRDSEFTEFVQGQWISLYRTAYLLTGDHQTAEDLLQTTLTKVYLRWSRIGGMVQPGGYARRMLVNLSSSWRRRGSAGERVVAVVPQAPAPSFDDDVVGREAMWQAIRALPPRQRAVLVLRYYEGLSEAEIAEVLDVAPGTVKAQAHAAVATLRKQLTPARSALTSREV